MQTECIPGVFGFEAVEGRQVIAAFDGGTITSDAGALLLRDGSDDQDGESAGIVLYRPSIAGAG